MVVAGAGVVVGSAAGACVLVAVGTVGVDAGGVAVAGKDAGAGVAGAVVVMGGFFHCVFRVRECQ